MKNPHQRSSSESNMKNWKPATLVTFSSISKTVESNMKNWKSSLSRPIFQAFLRARWIQYEELKELANGSKLAVVVNPQNPIWRIERLGLGFLPVFSLSLMESNMKNWKLGGELIFERHGVVLKQWIQYEELKDYSLGTQLSSWTPQCTNPIWRIERVVAVNPANNTAIYMNPIWRIER